MPTNMQQAWHAMLHAWPARHRGGCSRPPPPTTWLNGSTHACDAQESPEAAPLRRASPLGRLIAARGPRRSRLATLCCPSSHLCLTLRLRLLGGDGLQAWGVGQGDQLCIEQHGQMRREQACGEGARTCPAPAYPLRVPLLTLAAASITMRSRCAGVAC